MPIEGDEFESIVSTRGRKNYVLSFLRENYPKAYSIGELQRIFKKSETAIYLTIMRVSQKDRIERKFVGKKAYYRFKERAQ